MTESDFKKLLHAPYKRDTWKTVLSSIFPSSEFFIKDVPIEPNKNAKQIRQFGKITLSDGKSLGLFEVEVTPDTQIARNRVALRENASALIDFDRFHGALAIFYHPSQADYRFSFVAKQTELADGTIKVEQTHPKRFTYVLGINEPCTTPAKRFLKLLEKKEIKLEDVIEAFEVETLTKEFFKKYKDQYETFCEHLIESKYRKSVFKIPEIKDDDERKKAEKPIRDFVKKLLGRIVFLYFLQKKGWMGVPKDRKDWAGGDPEFMKNLFARFDNKKHFYSQCLVRLFFETLNTNRPNDLFEITGSRIPYLNGGLFDDDFPESNSIDLPTDLFQKLFEFFGEYNFTIDENSPDDHEVGIDPEMLGHIFENLLEDNKDKGAYYTPKAIVHYMCQESLIQYLKTHLGQVGAETAIERFIRIGDKGDEKEKNNFIRQNAARIEELLDTVKICDPAIGSGAFPMGLLQEILKAKSTLDWTLDRAKTKRNIIQNSIYGVDIDKGAVDIARLRFWLALVVDEEAPEPLPNLDYKIMQGNSLLESFEGIDLSKIMNAQKVTVVDSQMDLLTGKERNPQTQIDFNAARRDDLQKLLTRYFLENDKAKKIDLHRQIDRIVLDHIHASLEDHKDKLTIEISVLERIMDDRCAAVKTVAQREQIRTEGKEAKALAEKKREMAHVDDKFEKLRKLEETSERPYFLWHLYFRDIFDTGGFDIVIGNPPYISHDKIKEKDSYKQSYLSFGPFADIYCFFLELAMNLQSDNGVLCFITSNSFLKAEYGKNIRSQFSKRNTILHIINIEDSQFFEQAIVNNVIAISKNGKQREPCQVVNQSFDGALSFEDFIKYQSYAIDQDHFSEKAWILLRSGQLEIIDKMNMKGISLEKLGAKIRLGIATGANEVFIIDEERKRHFIRADKKNREIIKPVLQGRDILRYGYQAPGKYILLTKNGINVKRDYPDIYEYLDGFDSAFKKRGAQGEHWTNLRAASFYEDFKKEKIIWIELSDVNRFALCSDEIYLLNSAYFLLPPDNLSSKYILAVLNSRLIYFYLNLIAETSGMGTTRWINNYVKEFPIPVIKSETQRKLMDKVNEILHAKSKDVKADTQAIEKEIDVMVFKLYDLTYDEVKIVDPNFKMGKEAYEKFEVK